MKIVCIIKPPSESKTKEEDKRVGSNSVGFLEALAQLFTWERMFAPERSTPADSEARRESRERGNFMAIIPKPPVDQRAAGI